MRKPKHPIPARCSRGFSLIEVLIALVVLAFGLLGLALMQTMNLRFTQSANYRTIATNLSYDILDMVRANHRLRAIYSDAGYVSAGSPTRCAIAGSFDPAENLARWRCQVALALPGGQSQVRVAGDVATVKIKWTDARWETNAADQATELSVTTTL